MVILKSGENPAINPCHITVLQSRDNNKIIKLDINLLSHNEMNLTDYANDG